MTLPEDDVVECVTQVLDKMMATGLNSLTPIYPVMGMLRSERRLTPQQLVDLNHGFTGLYCALCHHIGTMRIAGDQGAFNYGFHELRDNVLILKHFPY